MTAGNKPTPKIISNEKAGHLAGFYYVYLEQGIPGSGFWFLPAATAAAAAGAVASARLDLGGNREAALVGAIIDEIYHHPPQRLKLFDQIRSHIYRNPVRHKRSHRFVRLIQSQSQYGAASAVSHKADKQAFSFVRLGLQHTLKFPGSDF